MGERSMKSFSVGVAMLRGGTFIMADDTESITFDDGANAKRAKLLTTEGGIEEHIEVTDEGTLGDETYLWIQCSWYRL
jgi:hypothetical protein